MSGLRSCRGALCALRAGVYLSCPCRVLVSQVDAALAGMSFCCPGAGGAWPAGVRPVDPEGSGPESSQEHHSA